MFRRGLTNLGSTAWLALAALSFPVSAQTPAPAAAIPVSVLPAEKRSIAQTADFVGRIEAVNKVEIKARVTGFLEEILFKDGAVITEGTPLFKIERGMYEAAVQQAEGNLSKAQGVLANAILQRERAAELARTGAGPVATRDQRVAEEKAAQGETEIAEANLRNAKINLDYTDIKSPINGRISRTRITKGNVVGPDSGILTTIVSADPIYVSFPVSQREFLSIKNTKQPSGDQAPTVRLTFSDGSTYDHSGRVDFVDVSVDRATDTVLVRATITNPDGKLTDGTLVRITLQSEVKSDKVLVPQAALIADQQGPYVFVVEGDKAAVKRVTIGGQTGAYTIIDKGLAGGEQVVVDGLQRLRPGVTVQAAPAAAPLETRK